MKLAIPIWQSRVSPVFDSAERLLIVDIENGREIARNEYPLIGLSPSGRAKRLVELQVDVLMCGAISRPVASLMRGWGIQMIPWLSGDVDDLLAWYLNGKTPVRRFLMPGCGKCRNRSRGLPMRGRAKHWTELPEDYV
jgi:predicted Fe-Mo cluster-binding NifX family protein